MRTKTVLRRARALIDTPDKWIQHRDHASSWINSHTKVDKFCVRGAIAAATHSGKSRRAAHRVLFDALPRDYMGGVIGYNDSPKTKHADVLALLDRAIESF